MKPSFSYIDTHAHLDGTEYDADRDEVVRRAQESGIAKIFVPAVNLESSHSVLQVCARYEGTAYPMIGLHPEEVKSDFKKQLQGIRALLDENLKREPSDSPRRVIAIGEVGLDYYWSRDYAAEQLEAFEEQVKWAVSYRLPLMIHCRKAQNEMVKLLRPYAESLVGGVFHCFTGNAIEASELLSFPRFALGIGGVLTFKKSHLPEVLPAIPLERVVLETDSPYMAPVPMRGKRNESAFTAYVLQKMAESYGLPIEQVAATTNANVRRIFGV